MQRDLFDMLGSFDKQQKQVFLRKHKGAALEQIGMEAKPNDLKGYAAGAKSYNSRSGKILGILAEMHDEFSRDLAAAQKAEFQALVAYHQLNAAKLSEIAEATKLKGQKESSLADTLD